MVSCKASLCFALFTFCSQVIGFLTSSSFSTHQNAHCSSDLQWRSLFAGHNEWIIDEDEDAGTPNDSSTQTTKLNQSKRSKRNDVSESESASKHHHDETTQAERHTSDTSIDDQDVRSYFATCIPGLSSLNSLTESTNAFFTVSAV